MSRLTECLEREVEELRAAIAARNAVILALVEAVHYAVGSSRRNVDLGNYGTMWTGVNDTNMADLEDRAHEAGKVVTS